VIALRRLLAAFAVAEEKVAPGGLGSLLTAIQSFCHQREQLWRRGKPIETSTSAPSAKLMILCRTNSLILDEDCQVEFLAAEQDFS
jgi:hypothetical protein